MQAFIFPLILIVMLVFMVMSQRKQQKQRQEQLSQIKKGDEIITIGGLHGVVDDINDKTFVLDCDGVYFTFERSAIRGKATPDTPPTSSTH